MMETRCVGDNFEILATGLEISVKKMSRTSQYFKIHLVTKIDETVSHISKLSPTSQYFEIIVCMLVTKIATIVINISICFIIQQSVTNKPFK